MLIYLPTYLQYSCGYGVNYQRILNISMWVDIRLWWRYTRWILTISHRAQLWLTVIAHFVLHILMLNIRKSMCLSIYVPINKSINQFIYLFSVYRYIHPSIHISVCLPACLSVRLSVHLYKYLHVYVLIYVPVIYVHNNVPICVHSYAHNHVLMYAPTYLPIHLCSYLFIYTSNINHTPKIYSPLQLRLAYQKLRE